MTARTPISKIVFQSMLNDGGTIINYAFDGEVISNNIIPPVINNCTLRKLTIKNGGLRNPKVEFINCDIDEIELINFSGTELLFNGGNYKKITINTNDGMSHNELHSLQITNIKSQLVLDINHVQFIEGFSVTKCESITDFICEHVKSNKFHITNSTITNNFKCLSSEFLDNVVLAGNYNNISITSLKAAKDIHLIKTVLGGELMITNSTINKLSISGNSDINKIEIKETLMGDLSMFKGKVGSFTLTPNDIEKIHLFHENGAEKIIIEEFIFNCIYITQKFNFSISNLNAKRFVLTNFRNKGEFRITDTNVTKEFSLNYCNLKPTTESESFSQISNLDLQDCKIVSLYRTNILGTEFFNVRWNSTYQLDHMKREIKGKSTDIKINHYWTIKESYRQLKIVSGDNDNKIDVNFFQSGELDIYYEVLKLKSTRKGKQIGDFLILWFSKVFGGYGLNIWKPIIWWGLFHSILFAAILHYGKFHFEWCGTWKSFDWETTKKAIGLYINLLNPVHSNVMYDHKILGISDFLIRLIAGFFIYYILKASRKFIFS
jgi:hypothetical protein